MRLMRFGYARLEIRDAPCVKELVTWDRKEVAIWDFILIGYPCKLRFRSSVSMRLVIFIFDQVKVLVVQQAEKGIGFIFL